MIPAFVEQRSVNRSRRAVLKSLLMKAGQDPFPLRGNKRPRNLPHSGGRRRKNTQTPLPVKRSTRKIEGLAGGSHSDRRCKIPDGRSHDTSVSAIGRPSSIATFFLNVDHDFRLAQLIRQPLVVAPQFLILRRQ